jgi:hypothetical protein
VVEAQDTQVADQSQLEGALEVGEGEGGRKEKTPLRGFEAIARHEIRRARKLVKDGEPTPEASFALSIANVLATLDLAAAIREHKSASTND